MDKLLEVIRDKSIDPEKRRRAAVCLGLLCFAEPVDDHTIRVTNDTVEKLQTYIKILRLKKEMTQ